METTCLQKSRFYPGNRGMERMGRVIADMTACRTPQGVPGHRPLSAVRGKPDPEALPHAYLCPQHRRRQVAVLVLSHEVAESEEGQRRDHQSERGTKFIVREQA